MILDAHDRVLLMRVKAGYMLPGGGIDDGEDVEAALRREVIEETGYDITIVGPLGRANQYIEVNEKRVYNKMGTFYRATLGAYVTEPVEDDHEVVWLPREDATRSLYEEAQQWAVRQVVAD